MLQSSSSPGRALRGRGALPGALLVLGTVSIGLLAGSARAGGGIHLPLNPCASVLTNCLGKGGPGIAPWSGSSVASRSATHGKVLTVTVPDSTVLRRLSPRDLGLGGIVTPRSLLLALAGRLGVPASSARAWTRRTVLLVDGKRWRPGGLFGYTKPALTKGWIRRIDVVEEPPENPARATDPRGASAPAHTDPAPPKPDPGPSVVDVILRNIRVSGAASIAAGVVEGSGPDSGGNAENYNLLLDVHDRRGDALILDFDYLRSTVPFFPYAYGYGYLPPP